MRTASGVDVTATLQDPYQSLAFDVHRRNTLLEKHLGMSTQSLRALGGGGESRETRPSSQTANGARKSPP